MSIVVGMMVGGGIGCVGYGLGYVSASRSKPRPHLQRPVCGCGHNLSFHEDGGRCRATEVDMREKWDEKAGIWTDDYVTVECSCQRYIGPELLPEVIAQ